MTFRKERYPADWKAIRAAIMARAGDACECTGQCGDPHADGAGARRSGGFAIASTISSAPTSRATHAARVLPAVDPVRVRLHELVDALCDALRGALRPTRDDGAAVLAAWRALDARMERDWLALVESAPVAGALARQWITAAQREARTWTMALCVAGDTAVTARAAVLVWAAVAAWTDAPAGAWGSLAVSDRVLRVADRLRGVMAETWAEMER